MKRHEAFPSKFLSAPDLAKGPKVVSITSVTAETMRDGVQKPAIFVTGYQKAIITNKTNSDVLYDLAGSDDDADWVGLEVELYSESTRRPDGTPCQAIRLRVPPKKKAAQIKKELNDEIPF